MLSPRCVTAHVTIHTQVTDCAARLERAQRLIGGLGGEKIRWTGAVAGLKTNHDSVVGDALLSAGSVAYLGVFPAVYREEVTKHWAALLKAKGIVCANHYSLSSALGDPVRVRTWTIAKLPNDVVSIDNAIMLFTSRRWPLCIDPQRQANRWIRLLEGPAGLKVVRLSSPNFLRTIENAVSFGTPVLIENVGESLDPVLEPLLTRAIVKTGGVNTIRLGDATVEYDSRFRLYLTTVLPNPHFAPETCAQVNLLDFSATIEGACVLWVL